MYLKIRKSALALLGLFSVLPAWTSALDTTVTLTADASITPGAAEVVTFGLPLAKDDVSAVSEIRVLIGGVEQLASIEPGLTWHWSGGSLRSVTIQLHDIDMTGGDVVVTIDDSVDNSGTQDFVAHSTGWETGPANKASMPFPRIFALHDLDYLSSTSIIPDYLPGNTSEGVGKLQFDQFDNGYGGLDFSDVDVSGNNVFGDGAQSAFLFDRATAMMKAYMSTGEVKFLKEGFMTKQLYYSYVRTVGPDPTEPGGRGCWTFGNVACADGKYIYTEPAKLAWALFGDNSQWDNTLIVEMATQADLGWNQPQTSDPYDTENEQFTERAAGIIGLAEINAYEITGDAGVLATMNSRISSLKDMQQVEHSWDTANGWTPRSGAFTHSWLVHEIDLPSFPGAGTIDDRRFSPWMSENIVDFLWHVYHVFNVAGTDPALLTISTADVGEMLRLVGNAIDLYGFTSEYQAGLGLDASYMTKPGLATISMSCTAPDNVPVSLLYSGSKFASVASIAATAASDGGFADQHNVETILSLGLAFYFETDPAAKSRLYSRILHIEQQWLSNGVDDPEDCSNIFYAPAIRLFNWQHRSNSVRTWDWILEEVGGIYDIKPNAFSFTNQTGVEPDTATTSNEVTISGLGTDANANITASEGTLVINGLDCSSDCTVKNTDTLAVKLTSAGTSLGSIATTVTVGTTVTAAFSATTRAITFDYPGWVWVAPAGCTDGDVWHYQCTGLWVDGGDFSTYPIIAACTTSDGATCTHSGDNRRWTSIANLTLTTKIRSCSVEPADLSARYSCAADDLRYVPSGTPELANPDAFSYTPQTGLDINTDATSNDATIAGLGIDADASTSNGTLIKNTVDCGATCTVSNGDTLAVRLTSSHLTGTTVSATVTVGAFSTDFDVTTSGPTPDTTPDSFSFPSLTSQELSTSVTSAGVAIIGLGVGIDADVTTNNGVIVKNSGDCAATCRVANGDILAVRLTTSAENITIVSATVTVGTYSTTFSTTTLAAAVEAVTAPEDINVFENNEILGDVSGITVSAGQVITNLGVVTDLINRGTLIGGTIGGAVVNTASAIINNVKLTSGSTVDGGTLRGILTGSGTLTNARVDVTSIDPAITIGKGSTVTSATVGNVSGLILTRALEGDQGRIELNQPILVEADGSELSVLDITKAEIDKLFGNGSTGFSDSPDVGTIEISNPDLAGLLLPVSPVSVQTTDEPDSVSLANTHGELVIISKGIKTIFTPAAANLEAFQAGIGSSGGSTRQLKDGSVSIEFDGTTFALRFSPVANLAPSSNISGQISISALTTGEATFAEVGTILNPATYRVLVLYPDGTTQEVLPAIHDSSAFDTWINAGGFSVTIDALDGIISFRDNTANNAAMTVWRGIPSYALLPPANGESGAVDFNSTTDLNGDGIGDIYFSTGLFQQVIYGLPPI